MKNFFKQNILLSKNAFISVFNILILLFLPFISLFLLQYIDLYAVNKGFGVILKWIINNVPIVIFNYLIWLSIIVLIYGLSGRFKATYITYILITLFIGAVEYLKLSNMGVPVLPWDTSKISEGLWSLKVMVGGINFYLIITLISLILIAVIIAIIKKVIKSNIKFCLKKFLPSHLPIRLASICLSLFFLISIFNFWKSPFAEMIEKSGAKTMLWDQKTSYERNGFFLSFVINEQYMHVSKPQSYSKEVIQSYNKNLEPKLDIKNKPVIIMILSESFWDITNVNGLRFSKDPLPTVHSLMQSGNAFTMASSEVGGGTANVEFEALTGLSTAFLPGGSIAYSQYIKQPLPSLPRLLKEYGYTTIAVHPYVSTFWNRNKVYPLIGFDNFVTIKDMKDVSKKGNYASDDYFVHQIIAQYQKYSADDKPLFVFGVSMQNHFPYSKGVYGQNDIKITGNGLGSYKTGMFECYSQGISDADASLKTLIDYFKTVDRPVNIVFFGDHFPALKGIELNKLSAKTSVSPYIDRNSEYFDSLINKFTPVVFWSNYDAKIPNCEGHQYSSLSYSVLDFAGLPKNPYFSLLSQIGSELPIIQNGITVTPDGKIGSFKDSPKDVFEKARIINYDSIFGKRYALEDLWH